MRQTTQAAKAATQTSRPASGLAHHRFGAGLALLAVAFWLITTAGPMAAAAPTGDPPETLIFESRAPGHAGGGLSVRSTSFHGHTFRVTERTEVTRVGAYVRASAERTVFMAIYRVNMLAASPDVVNDSRLVATALLDVPATGSNSGVEASTALSAILEPGWYAVMIGTGRYGATAPSESVTLVPTGTATTPQSRGPYSVNTTTNNVTLQSSTARFSVYGHSLPAVPRPATDFLFETAGPAALHSSATTLNNNQIVAIRFHVERPSRIDRLSAWLGFGNGDIFAAIFPIDGPTAHPPLPNSPAFESSAVHRALVPVGASDEYTVDLDGLRLPAGHYAVVFGSGRFGASGSAGLFLAVDQIVVPGSLFSPGSSWSTRSHTYPVRLTGIVPEFEVAPQQLDFGQVPLSGSTSRSVTVRNLRDDEALAINDIHLSETSFQLDPDVLDCLVIAADDECTFSVHYHGEMLGPHAAHLVLVADAVPNQVGLPMIGETMPSALVTPSSLGNGLIDPATAQLLFLGDRVTFTLTPAIGHQIDQVTGSCGGSLDGAQFTTDPVSEDCSVIAEFAIDRLTVSAAAVGNGSIDPSGSQTVDWGSTLSFTLTPDQGYHIDQVLSDCGGRLKGTVYDTGPITADCAVQALFALDEATTLSLVSGSGQSTQVGTAFAAPLVLQVSNDAGLPVPGVTVQVQVPGSGASANAPATAISADNGQVSITATANTIAGAYAIQASADGLTGKVVFQLDNLAGPAEQVLVLGGDGQSAQVNSGFATPLRVRVLDSHDNAVPDIEIAFSAPGTGAGATLAPSSVTTDGDGEAQTLATANAVPGTYAVTATATASAATASINLENLTPKLALSITIDDDLDHIAYGEINDYLVTIGNAGSDPATGVEILVPLPDQLEVTLSEWLCLDLGSGCTAAGTGSLSDKAVTVPAGGSVRYRILAPVLDDAPGERVEIEAYAESTYHEPVLGGDWTWLVLFRDGLESEAPDTDEIR